MTFRIRFIITLLICFSSSLFNTVYAQAGMIQGKVTETMNSSGYTYAEVDTGKDKVWAAGPVSKINVGDEIKFSTVMPMKNFHSKSLNRDFSVVYFVQRFVTGKESDTDNRVINSTFKKSQKKSVTPVKNMTKAKNGYTIAEIFSDQNNLAGKTVRVRGQVTRFTAKVLNKNWLHIKDSSNSNDLTVTTSSKVDVDDVVVVSGKLELNKDFGYGYVYALIVEDATVIKE